MISQKARLSEGPLVRKSDNYLIGIISFVDNPMTNKLLSLCIYLWQQQRLVLSCVALIIGYIHYVFKRNVADVISSLKWMKDTDHNY